MLPVSAARHGEDMCGRMIALCAGEARHAAALNRKDECELNGGVMVQTEGQSRLSVKLVGEIHSRDRCLHIGADSVSRAGDCPFRLAPLRPLFLHDLQYSAKRRQTYVCLLLTSAVLRSSNAASL